jgi:mono/diheme cytochrome c family protein
MSPYYPIPDHGPLTKGMVTGGLGAFHVYFSQMAIGGGMLLCYFEWLRRTGRGPNAARFINGDFQALVVVSFVMAALTGVAMWFTSIQFSPRTIGTLVDEFHWIWATAWTFSCVEVISGYAFVRYKDRLSGRGRMMLLAIYSAAAWISLFWINGTLSFPLTPGRWVVTHDVWSGFFNPSFWPSLLYRTVAAMALAALAACVVIHVAGPPGRDARRELIGHASRFLGPMVLMPLLGLWFLASVPADSRSWALGGNAITTLFVGVGIGASLLIGAYGLGAFRYLGVSINGFTAALLCALAFAATAGGEFLRDGMLRPYSIRQVLYANAQRQDELERLRTTGSVTDDPYPLRDRLKYPHDQLRTGAKVFRIQCRACHTYEGANGLIDLTATWTLDQKRQKIAQSQRTKAFMPPFAGNATELEALVQLLSWRHEGMPRDWPISNDPATLAKIKAWLDEVGTRPGIELMGQGRSLAQGGPKIGPAGATSRGER